MIQITEGAKIEPLKVKVEEESAFCLTAKEVSDDGPLYQDIRVFLEIGTYPKHVSKKDKKILRRLAAHFLLSGDTLYKRSFDTTLLRCVDKKEAGTLMKEIHKGACGPHMNGYMLARKIAW